VHSFEHVDVVSTKQAVELLAGDPRARAIAGGTDLVPEMRLGLRAPDRLINLKTLAELQTIRADNGTLRLGALAPLHVVADHQAVVANAPALVAAIKSAASPQIRTAATIGGNLLQESRCWYFRGPFHCWLKGGPTCDAAQGENSRQAIFGGGPCYTVQPSDPATALVALGARIRIQGIDGQHTMPLSRFFTVPTAEHRALTNLGPGEVLTAVEVSWPAPGERSGFRKAMDRAAFSFALASVAWRLGMADGVVRTANLVLGGVAPVPWRAAAAERALVGQRLTPETIDRVAQAATTGAHPLALNDYKVPLVQGLVREVLCDLSSD
jgi:xanthine dehydrogenase YagS FAD-binding subunit